MKNWPVIRYMSWRRILRRSWAVFTSSNYWLGIGVGFGLGWWFWA